MLITFCPQQIVFVLNSAVGTTIHANMLAGVLSRVGLDLQAALLAVGQAPPFVGREEFVWSWAEYDEQSCTSSLGGAVCGTALLLSCLHAPVLLPVPPLISRRTGSVGGTLIIPWLEEDFFPSVTFLLAGRDYLCSSKHS